MTYTEVVTPYQSQAAKDARAIGYGAMSYWDYLERSAQEMHRYFTQKGDDRSAARILTRSLSEALIGNEGK